MFVRLIPRRQPDIQFAYVEREAIDSFPEIGKPGPSHPPPASAGAEGGEKKEGGSGAQKKSAYMLLLST